MWIKTFYVLTLLSDIKLTKNIFFPDHSGINRTADPFYPAWGKMGHFSDAI